jgi:oxygen-independent coproporphyrinogen-3 oxidase
VSQLHFGGGSPTFLSDDELEWPDGPAARAFKLAPGAEISIEVDPRTATPHAWRTGGHGFNRISFGVQDFDPDVQQAVHRVQSFESVRDLVWLRAS